MLIVSVSTITLCFSPIYRIFSRFLVYFWCFCLRIFFFPTCWLHVNLFIFLKIWKSGSASGEGDVSVCTYIQGCRLVWSREKCTGVNAFSYPISQSTRAGKKRVAAVPTFTKVLREAFEISWFDWGSTWYCGRNYLCTITWYHLPSLGQWVVSFLLLLFAWAC